MARSLSFIEQAIQLDFMIFVQRVFQMVSPGDEFAHNWHLEAIGWALEEIELAHNHRLIVNVPPRSLKSIIISVAWPAWLLGHDPCRRIVCISYSGELSRKLARDCRRVMESEWYRRIFPKSMLSRRTAEHDFETVMGGGRFSTSVDGTLTGRGGDILIIDDPMKAGDAYSEAARRQVIEFFRGTALSRLNDKKRGAIIVVMQRLHEEDLSGHLLETGGYRHLCLPARAVEDELIPIGPGEHYRRPSGELLQAGRENEAFLAEQERLMGSAAYSAQYQQEPIPASGVMVQRRWLKHYDVVPQRYGGNRLVQSWDTATKDGIFNDYSCCVTALVCGNHVYVLDVFREKLTFPELKAAVIRLAGHWRADVLAIEDAASGAQLIQTLRAERPQGVPSPIAMAATNDKRTRFACQTARIEAGDLLLPREAPWLAPFLHEILGFPHARYDDQADALAHLLDWSGRFQPEIPINAGPILVTPNDDWPYDDYDGPLIDDPWGA